MSYSQSYAINLQVLASAEQALASLKEVQAQLDMLSKTAITTTANTAKLAEAQAKFNTTSASAAGAISSSSKSLEGQLATAKLMSQEYVKHTGFLNDLYGPNRQQVIKQHLGTLSGLQTAYKALNDEMAATVVKGGKGFNGFLDESRNNIAKFRIQADMAVQSLDQMNTKWTNMGKNAQWTGRQAMVGVTAPILAGAGIAIEQAVQQNQADIRMKQLSGAYMTGARGQQGQATANQYIQAGRSLSTGYGTTYAENVQGLGELQGLGFYGSGAQGTQNVKSAMTQANQLNMIGQMNNLSGAQDFMRRIEQTSGLGGTGSIGYGNNVLSFLNQYEAGGGSINMNQISDAITKSNIIPVMQSSNMNLGQVVGLISQAKANGVDPNTFTNQLATSISRIEAGLASGSGQVKGNREKYIGNAIAGFQKQTGSSFTMFNKDGSLLPAGDWIAQLSTILGPSGGGTDEQSRALASAIFSPRGMANLQPVFAAIGSGISGQGGKPTDYLNAVNMWNKYGPGGSQMDQGQADLNKTTADIQQEPSQKLKEMWQGVKNTLAQIGVDLMPTFEKFLGWLQKILDGWNKLSNPTKHLLETLALVAAAVGPLAYVFGQINIVLSTLTKFSVTKPLLGLFGLKAKLNAEDAPGDLSTKLTQLNAMKRSGEITPQEFEKGYVRAGEQFQGRQDLLNSYGGSKENIAIAEQIAAMHEERDASLLLRDAILENTKVYQDPKTGKFISKEEAAKQDIIPSKPQLPQYDSRLNSGKGGYRDSSGKIMSNSVAQDMIAAANPGGATAKELNKEETNKATQAVAQSVEKAGAAQAAKDAADVAKNPKVQKAGGSFLSNIIGGILSNIPIPGLKGLGKVGEKGAATVAEDVGGAAAKGGGGLLGGLGKIGAVLPGAGIGSVTELAAAAGPLLPILAAVAAAVALIATHWSTFYKAINGGLKDVIGAFKGLWNAISSPFKDVFNSFSKMNGGVSIATELVKGLGDAANLILHLIAMAVNNLKPIFEVIGTVIASTLGIVINLIGAIIDLCQGKFGKAWDLLRVVAADAVYGIIKVLELIPKSMLSMVSNLAGLGSHLPSWLGGNIFKGLKSGVDDASKSLDGWATAAKNAIAPADANTNSTNKNADSKKKAAAATKDNTAATGDNTNALTADELAQQQAAAAADAAAAAQSAHDDQVKTDISAMQSSLKNVVGDWVSAAENAFAEFKKKQLQSAQDGINSFDKQTTAQDKAFDNATTVQDKFFDDKKKKLTEAAQSQDDYNKALSNQINMNIDLVEGKTSDATLLWLQGQSDMTKASNQNQINAIDTQKQIYDDKQKADKQAYDDQRAAGKQALTDQKQNLSDQLDAQDKNLKEELNLFTKYLPHNQDAANAMQQGILGILQKYTGQYGGIATSDMKQWNENWNTALTDAKKSVDDAAWWSGQEAASFFANAFGLDPASAQTSGPPPSVDNSGPPGPDAAPPAEVAQPPGGPTGFAGTVNSSGADKGPTSVHPAPTHGPFHTGGQIPGLAASDVPIIAQAGEYMIQRRAAEHLGTDFLEAMNTAHMTPKYHAGGKIDPSAALQKQVKSQVQNWMAGGPPDTIAGISLQQAQNKFITAMFPGMTSLGGTSGSEVVDDARRYLGIPYVWGGEGPNGFDCSGLVQQVFRDLGITLPRTSFEQVKYGEKIGSLGAAQPGDLLFFDQDSHVGIYAGGGNMIDAAHAGAPVRVEPVWAGLLDAIRRIIGSVQTMPGANSPVAPVNLSAMANLGKNLARPFGWDSGPEWNALWNTFNKESGWDPWIVNTPAGPRDMTDAQYISTYNGSRAYGIPQSLGHGHPYALGDATSQINWGLNYIRGKWIDPIRAWGNETSQGWYHSGGLVMPSQMQKLSSFDTGGHVGSTGIAMVHQGETVLKKPLSDQFQNNLNNIGSGDTVINLNFSGHYFGTDRDLQKLGEYMESNVIPKIQRAKGQGPRNVSSYQ